MVLDSDQELFKLARVINWSRLEAEFGSLYCPDNGRPGVPIRLMAGLHFLKHMFGLSDEQVVAQWVLNPYWQFFCGEEFFQHKLPIHPSQMTRWRKRVGEAGVEKLLGLTIEAGKQSKTITERSFEKVIVDTTVQPKAIQHPTDARLYRKVHGAMLRIAEAEGLKLRQSYRKLMEWGFRKHGGYMKTKQFKWARKVLRSLKTMAGRVVRDVERKLDDAAFERNKGTMILSELILDQKRKTKNKVYSLHASEVECIGKGKAHRPYDHSTEAQRMEDRTESAQPIAARRARARGPSQFGVKVSLAVTHKEGFCVGTQTCPGNPFDGHTLEGQLDQVERLTGKLPAFTFVDRGYKGHDVAEERSRVLISGTRKLSYTLKRHMRRRAAIEPEIGHMKGDGLLGRNFLKGVAGDAINALLCGAGHNLRKILARLRALLYLLSGGPRVALKAFLDRIGLQSFLHPISMPA